MSNFRDWGGNVKPKRFAFYVLISMVVAIFWFAWRDQAFTDTRPFRRRGLSRVWAGSRRV